MHIIIDNQKCMKTVHKAPRELHDVDNIYSLLMYMLSATVENTLNCFQTATCRTRKICQHTFAAASHTITSYETRLNGGVLKRNRSGPGNQLICLL